VLQAETVPATGQDDRVEWEVRTNWKIDGTPIDIVHSLDGKMVFILDSQQRVLVYDNNGKLQGRIPVGEGVTAIDIAPQGESLYLIDKKDNSFTSVAMNYVHDIDVSGSPFKGKVDAPVTVTVFTDFECPYCGKLVPLLDQIFENNTETVKLVFKNMPLNFHKMAEPAHRAAMAAGLQGKFWEYHDKLFMAKKLSNELILNVATEIGLDVEKFKKDMNSSIVQQKIRKDLADAQLAGVTGTPTVFINGRKLSQRSLQGFQQIIDEEIAKAGK
jgi:protein-disulfide isomerase